MKKVIFISAGPGDPDLITVKAINHLKKSEIVLVDRLVSPEIVNEYLHPKRKILYVGKNNDSIMHKEKYFFKNNQKSINHLMVYHALKGKYVVRLKGGDVSIFSNIMDELIELNKYHIPYEIIPGVTAALGAAAYTGIPLTARGYASSVRFVTLHNPNSIDSNQWEEFLTTKDTLVFYMCIKKLYYIIDKFMILIKKKESCYSNKLIAIIEQATTPMQKVYTTTLYNCKKYLIERNFLSPSLVIIGKIVNLYKCFKWNSSSSSIFCKRNYFMY
ncbi:MAG: uroporphyrinogen-III C-methyltransferase [Flavobacteriales bacterium]|jgi:uroporphyrin-III C-methyltransferase|uniref:uroporphyrinogen-III C-methyltransferase n=1 Tax=Blattabacterium sp. (Mastotermes darwiniensis) TaxID=39768 RepID=UPI000231DE4A|nr:uroporphyrinogen-III C-methyltransferase [Blattabacterium sp. (Mastotermes darwiniensis)]AER40638.1 siroheme synthase [Blattabacterium sp. (Mastotermes darwiniensis) str. MADAR]MDR1804834.1 uroporphyrinogen-III C-methyltransferase [Flavobacteriales bacterium]